jgi:hypothetical protein
MKLKKIIARALKEVEAFNYFHGYHILRVNNSRVDSQANLSKQEPLGTFRINGHAINHSIP